MSDNFDVENESDQSYQINTQVRLQIEIKDFQALIGSSVIFTSQMTGQNQIIKFSIYDKKIELLKYKYFSYKNFTLY